MKTIKTCSTANWQEVLSNVNRATVFIDNVCAELLHWQGGLPQLLQAGANSVKEFSSFESGSPDQKKAVFLVGAVLEGVTKEILQDIIQASHFQYVVLITTHSSLVHTFSRRGIMDDSPEFFEQVEERLREWMGNMNYTAEVFYIPLLTVSMDNSLFLTPGYAKLFPLIDSDLHQLQLLYNNSSLKSEERSFDSLRELEMVALPKDLQILYKSFVSSVDSLLMCLGVREDIYSLGPTSALLAGELEAYPLARGRRKAQTNRASVVFMDRSLDMASVTSHSVETLMDKIVQLLPRLTNHTADVSVNMSTLCHVHRDAGDTMVLPGCLASTTGSQSHLQTVVAGKQKEALMEVNRRLVEAAGQCNLPVSLKGRPSRVTAEQLDATLKLFKGKYQDIATHLDSIQLAMATSLALKHPDSQHQDELISVEKGLVQSLADQGAQGAFPQILRMIDKMHEGSNKWVFSLDDILCALVYVYSLGVLDADNLEEQSLQTKLADRILQEKQDLPPLMKSIVGDAVADRSIVVDILEDMWSRLEDLAASRRHLTQFRSILDPGSAVSPASHNSLCKQVVETIFDPGKKEVTDLEFKASGLKDMLKSGFGLFRSVAKPSPSDHPLLLLFIVGGVTTTEVKQIRDVINLYKPATEVIVGSTRLLTPADAVKSVLCQNNINPMDGS